MLGRPPKFGTVEELQEKINAYFESCDNRTTKIMNSKGKMIEVPDPRPYTITGLALALDTTRRTLLDYETIYGEEFSHTIKMAKQKIENFAEESLWQPKIATGVIFNLKNNYGWVDKTEVETSGETTVNNKIDLKNVSTDDIREFIEKLDEHSI